MIFALEVADTSSRLLSILISNTVTTTLVGSVLRILCLLGNLMTYAGDVILRTEESKTKFL